MNLSELTADFGDCDHARMILGPNVDGVRGDYFLHERPAFRNFRSLSLVGDGEDIRINCLFAGDSSSSATMEVFGGEFFELRNLKFDNCSGEINIVEVITVRLFNSAFRHFSSGCVNIHNSTYVDINGSVFNHCKAFTESNEIPFQALGGGLSVTFVPGMNEGSLMVTDSIFAQCESMLKGDPPPEKESAFRVCGSTLDAFGNSSLAAAGSGGGLAVGLGSPHVNISISNSFFTGNEGGIYGGAIFIFMTSIDSSIDYQIEFNRVQINSNVACAGGGVGLGPLIDDFSFSNTIELRFEDCEFRNNRAFVHGGAAIISPRLNHMNVTFKRSTFTNNSALEAGSALLIAPLQFSLLVTSVISFVAFENCNFTYNEGQRLAALTTRQSSVYFKGRNIFKGNIGVAYGPIITLTNVMGELIFDGNQGQGRDGGAVYITDHSQINLHRGSQLRFMDNVGSLGSALVLERLPPLSPYSQLFFNPLCYFLFEEETVPPTRWHEYNVSLSFEGNSASYGAGALLSQLDMCSWVSLTPPYFDRIGTLDSWPFVSVSNNTNSFHEDPMLSNWTIQTPVVEDEVLLVENEKFYYPGEKIHFEVTSKDEYGKDAVSFIKFSVTSRGEEARGQIVLLPVVATHAPANPNISFTLALTSREYIPGEVSIELQRILSTQFDRSDNNPIQRSKFLIKTGPCPAGLSLQEEFGETGVFVCDCITRGQRPKTELLNCLEENALQLDFGFWGSTFPNSSSSSSPDVVQIYPCPYSYCRCTVAEVNGNKHCTSVFNPLDTNSQCSCGRQGFLCGGCTAPNGITTIFNRCVSCTTGVAVLIPFLFVIDIIAVIFVLEFFRRIPSLLVPTLFYIQTFPYMIKQAYFPQVFQASFYLNELLSFNFPWDLCLFPGATAVVVYVLRYLPFVATLLAVGLDLLVRKIYHKRNKRIGYDIGLWTVTLLMFNSLVYTSMSIFNCPSLKDENGYEDLVWFVDGTVKCFRGAHIPLALLALSALFFCIAIILFFVVTSLWPQLLQKRVFKRFEMYHSSAVDCYKERWKWMPVVELTKRMVLIFLTQVFYSRGFVPRSVLVTTLLLYTLATPYKSTLVNITEVVVQVLMMLYLLHVSFTDVFGTIETVDERRLLAGCESPFDVYRSEWLSVLLSIIGYAPLLLLPIGIGLTVFAKCRMYRNRSKPAPSHKDTKFSFDLLKSCFRKRRADLNASVHIHYNITEVMLQANPGSSFSEGTVVMVTNDNSKLS